MKRKQLLAFAIGVLALAAILSVRPAAAVTLIPPSMEFSVSPGETLETKVKLFNETAEVITQYSSTANFTAKDETGTPNFAPETDRSGLASWIALEPGPFTLQPGERKEIPVTIRVAEDAEPGGHYAGIFFSARPPEADTGQIAIASKIGALVLVRVAGQINEVGTIVSFGTADGATSYSRLPIDLAVRMRNDGNVHFRPTGNVTIRNMLGGTTRVLSVNQTLGAVLPVSTRRFDVTWEKEGNAEQHGNFFNEIGAEWKNFALGPYTADVVLMYGQANDKTATAAFRFWVFPWRILLVSLIVVVLLIWLIVLLIKRYNQWILARAKAEPPQEPQKK